MMDQKQNAVEQDARSVARIETTVDDTLLKSVAWICKHYKREKSEEALRQQRGDFVRAHSNEGARGDGVVASN